MCQRVSAPASYLRELPADLVVANINHGLQNRTAADGEDKQVNLLLHKNGGWHVQALTGTGYSRIWNSDITKRLFNLRNQGWKVPPARPALKGQPGTRIATAEDVIPQPGFSLAIKVGDTIAPAGLYASDRDMFAFLVNSDRVITAAGRLPCSRGAFFSNSEVGDKSFRLTRFLMNAVCGNHVVWGASDIASVAIRHVGTAPERAWHQLSAKLTQYANEGTSDETLKIESSKRRFLLGESGKDEVLDQFVRA